MANEFLIPEQVALAGGRSGPIWSKEGWGLAEGSE